MSTGVVNIGDFPNPPRRYRNRSGADRAQQHPQHINHVLYVLRGLPGEPLMEEAKRIAGVAVSEGVKTVAILSSEDFLVGRDGKYDFDAYKLQVAHRRNFERATAHFTLGTEVVILANPNIKRSHYFHYLQVASFYYYHTEEIIVGDPIDVDAVKARELASATASQIPESLILRYSLEFEQ